MSSALPAELWIHVFNFAVEDDSLFDHALPTSMAESTWFKMIYGDWSLRAPNESQNLLQRRSYITKKAIMATCKLWRRLGVEFLFRCLYFNDPGCLQRLFPILDGNTPLGWWTKRLHITRYYAGAGSTMDAMEHALISTIRQCPNLEIFIVNWPISSAPTAVIDALCTFCPKSLRTVHLNVPCASLAKIIWMLDSLPELVSAHLEFDGPAPEFTHLGSASGITLTLSSLQQLSLCGACQEFMEQATGWDMPALNTLSLDFLNYRSDMPDVLEFLTHHGARLTFLDVNCIPALDVAAILDLCPLLTTFAFNLDWRLTNTGDPRAPSALVHRPHAHITTIGCHQLLHAFGVGYAATYAAADRLTTHLIRRRNDVNFAALHRGNFPRLQRVRVLSRMLLRDLEAANGPDRVCYERWERWWTQCEGQHVRLEDCTGALLGTLPENEVEAVEDEEDDESEEDEPQDALLPLRDLLAECRQMSSTIDASPQYRRSTLGRTWQ